MTLHRLIQTAITVSEPEAPVYRELPTELQRDLVAAYIKEQGNEWSEVIDTLPDSYLRLMFVQMVLGNADVWDWQNTISHASIVYYADNIQGHMDDQFDDYCDSNGIHPPSDEDEYCAERRFA
jgi:hypothetical protein